MEAYKAGSTKIIMVFMEITSNSCEDSGINYNDQRVYSPHTILWVHMVFQTIRS